MQNNVNLAPGCSTSGQHKCEICPSQFPLKEDLIVHQLLFHSYSTSQLSDKDVGMNMQRRPGIPHPAEVRSSPHPSSFPSSGLSNYQSSWGHNARSYQSTSVRSPPNLPYAAHNFGFPSGRERPMQTAVNLVHGSQGTGQYKCDRCTCQFQVREDLVVHQILCHQANPPMPYQRLPSDESQRISTSLENQPGLSRHPSNDMGLGYRDTRNPYYFGSGFAYPVPGSYQKEGYGPAGMGNMNPIIAPPHPQAPHSGVNNFTSRNNHIPVTSHDLTHLDHNMPSYSASGPLGHPSEVLDLSYNDGGFQKHPDPSQRTNVSGRQHAPGLSYQDRTFQREDDSLTRSNMNHGKGYSLTYVHSAITEDPGRSNVNPMNDAGRSTVNPMNEHHMGNQQQRAMNASHMNQAKEHEVQIERPVLQLLGDQRHQGLTNERRDLSMVNHDIMATHRNHDMTLTTHQDQRHNDMMVNTTQRHHDLDLSHQHTGVNRGHQTAMNMQQNMIKPVDISIPYKHRNRADMNFPGTPRKQYDNMKTQQDIEKRASKKKKSKVKQQKSHDQGSSSQDNAGKKQSAAKKQKRGISDENNVAKKVYPPPLQNMGGKIVSPQEIFTTVPSTSTTNSVMSINTTQTGKHLNASSDPRKRWQNIQQSQPSKQQVAINTVKQCESKEKSKNLNKEVKIDKEEKRKSPQTVQAVIEEKLKNKEDSVDLAKGEGTGPHKCEKCGSGFRMKADLDMHLLVFHSLKKPKEPVNKIKAKTPDQVEKIKQTTMKKTVDNILRMLPNKRKPGGVKGEVKVVSISYRCQTCDESFLTIVGLEEHQFANHKCRTCEFTFDNKEQLQRHKIIAHMCGQCGHYFEKNESRKDHPCQDNVCSICGEILESREKLLEHNAENHKCSGCRASFLYKADLIKHQLENHGHRCEICGYHFKWKEGLKQHMLASHGMKCVTCKARFTTKEELDDHIMENHKCNICSLFFKNKESLTKHKDFIHVCKMCGKVFEERDKLTKHQYEAHKCSLCNEIFKLKTDLETHRKTIHKCCFCGVLFDSKHVQDNHPCKTYKCPCGANYETEDELELHSENNHFCTYCDTFFLMKDEFRSHWNTNHKCSICNVHYILKANLDKHKESDHKCLKCGAKPDYDKGNPDVCKCGENLKNEKIENGRPPADVNQSNAKGTEPITSKDDNKCDSELEGSIIGNNKKTDSATSLVAPISVVIKEKIYCGDEEISKECEYCDTLFPDNNELEKHLKTCSALILRTHLVSTRSAAGVKEEAILNPENSISNPENSISNPENSISNPVVKLTCSHGELEFPDRDAMEKHMREQHPGYAKAVDKMDQGKMTMEDDKEQISVKGKTQATHQLSAAFKSKKPRSIIFKCRYCHWRFLNSTRLKQHIGRHKKRHRVHWYSKNKLTKVAVKKAMS